MFDIINPFDGEQLHPLADRLEARCFCEQNPQFAKYCPVHNPRDLVSSVERAHADVEQEIEDAKTEAVEKVEGEYTEAFEHIADKLKEVFGIERVGSMDEEGILAMIDAADTKVTDFRAGLAEKMQEALGDDVVVESDEQGLTQAVAQLAANAEKAAAGDPALVDALTTCARLLNAVLVKRGVGVLG